ncbi:hypothetical protein ANCDUO_12790 [Ancylostoma duodenale]|uniref:Uncharacterized protein n=1 Tax=Ancylostoma duodenale TaxID=51022 RepID=A0A0C2GIW8_9BILA|nr:hypothetical protein ANCDUO_12790 [Ancylostoma duodenale]
MPLNSVKKRQVSDILSFAQHSTSQNMLPGVVPRFFDRNNMLDRTAKSCQCVQEKICSIIGMHAHAGCRTYSSLSSAGQRLIRLWSIDEKDRRYRFSNDVRKRFSDKQSYYH